MIQASLRSDLEKQRRVIAQLKVSSVFMDIPGLCLLLEKIPWTLFLVIIECLMIFHSFDTAFTK